jgi:hypothetical protein
MKTAHHLERLEPLILKPLHGLDGDRWHRAPRGRWSIVQIVQHVAIGIDLVARSFRELAESSQMERQHEPQQTVLRHLTLGVGHYPGALKALPHAKPDAKPDPELVSAQFRMGVEEYRDLSKSWSQESQLSRFVPHPLLGDLNLPEWIRFHYLHCRHHGREIQSRLKWLGRR